MFKKSIKIIPTTLVILTLAFIGLATLKPKTVKAAPATFVVNSINDGADANNGDDICETSTPGECTLRAAVQQANTNGNPLDQDVVSFNISGTGLHTITSTAQFTISESLEIDGYSQNGATANSQVWPAPFDGTLTIEIDSSGIPNNYNAFSIESDNVTFKGLIANGSPTSEFIIAGVRNNVSFYGNYIGTDSSGLAKSSANSNRAIFDVEGGSGLVVGGSLAEERNIIVSEFTAISTQMDNLTVQGNYIGVGADGVTPLPTSIYMNSFLVDSYGNNTLIGGTAAGEGNSIENANNFSAINLDSSTNSSILGNRISGNFSAINVNGESSGTIIGNGTTAGRNIISGNDILSANPDFLPQDLGHAITLYNQGSVSIKGNYIGVAEDGTTALGNGKNGIRATDSDGLIIGGTAAGEGNIIANNGLDGIEILDGISRVSIIGNSVYNNGGLGIDIAPDGVNLNDSLDADTGPNGLLNYPNLLVPVESGGNTEISYRLDVPAGDYRVEFFSNTSYDSSGHGEGRTFIDSDPVTSLGAGAQLFNATLTGDTFENISATVTEIDVLSASGFGSTSEFSGQPFSDGNLSVSKAVVDQDTIITNGTVQYDVSITNTGNDPIDLTQYTVDSGDPLNTALFNDIFPNNLTLDSVTGDADCSEQNPVSDPLFGTQFSAHTGNLNALEDYTIGSCSYTGVLSSLAPSGVLNFTLSFSLTDPSLNAYKNYVLTVPSTSDSDYSEYDDAVSSGNDILDILEGTIDNLAVATTTQPESDISITKELLTATGDVVAGGDLSYELTYTNNGGDPLHVGGNIPFVSAPLFYDYIHPDLSITAADIIATDDTSVPGLIINTIDAGNPELLCLEGEPPAALLIGLTAHPDYGFVSCWYIGPDLSLATGDSYSATFNFDVAGGSDLDFANYAFANPNIGGSVDPDSDNIDDAIAAGDDLLDGLIKYQGDAIDNFSISRLPIDVTVTSEVLDPPTTISEGTPIKLLVNIQNNGPASFSLSQYTDSLNSVLNILFPSNDVSFEGVEGDTIQCVDTSVAAPSLIGVSAQDHPDHNLIICSGIGSEIVVPSGDSQTITLLFSAKSTVTSTFNFYGSNASASSDPDIPTLFGAIFGATEDILDTIDNGNYSSASYSGTVVVNPGTTPDDSTVSIGNGLSNTGQNVVLLIAVATVLIGSSFIVYKKTRQNKSA